MKILRYKKYKNNEYIIITSKGEYKLYDDIIVKYELLLKKEISEKEFANILTENNFLNAYYTALKLISTKMRTEKEIFEILQKNEFKKEEIEYTIKRLKNEKYLNNRIYIETYIHDHLCLKIEGVNKIHKDLINLGFNDLEILPVLSNIDKEIFKDKISKYIDKKLKTNKKSINEFKRKTLNELINKGFEKDDINNYLNNLNIEENEKELEKLILKLYNKYIKKYDLYTTKLKMKNYLFQKGYNDINIDIYLENI